LYVMSHFIPQKWDPGRLEPILSALVDVEISPEPSEAERAAILAALELERGESDCFPPPEPAEDE